MIRLGSLTLNARKSNYLTSTEYWPPAWPIQLPKMPAPKKNKATKKFEKKHLKGVLEQRKATAKVNQRQKLKQKPKYKRKDAEFYGKDGDKANGVSSKKKDARVGEMSVDDFFSGGFEMLEEKGGSKKGAKKLGKRKRDTEELESEQEAEGSTFGDVDEQPVVSDSEDEPAGDDEDRGMSKKTMEELATKDPEFYKFLKETDPEALDFDEDADLAEVDGLSEGEDSSEEQQTKKKKRRIEKEAKKEKETERINEQEELTSEMVSKWKDSMIEKKSLCAARQTVHGFRCAAHLNEDDVEGVARKLKFTIRSSQVYNDMVDVALKYVPEVLQHHLPAKESSSGKMYVQTESKKFKALSNLLKSYTASVLHLLGVLADDKRLTLTISALEPLLPYLLSFRKLLQALVKKVVRIWAQLSSSETTRITAFLILRRLVVIGDKGVGELVVKTSYQDLLASCRVTKHNTLPSIILLKNMAAQLWHFVDPSVGYTTAFALIRQLAVHLRNSFNTQKKDTIRTIYNWQFTHSLDFWSIVISEHCNTRKEGEESHFRPLIYPLTMITLGTMDKIPSATYFPLKFHLVRACLRISHATDTYIPLATPLLEVLNAKEMKHPPKPSKLREDFDFSVNYRTPDSVLRTRAYQDGVGDQIVELFSEFFFLWAKSIAFPEFSLPVVIQLKRWLKQAGKKSTGNRNAKVSSALVVLLQKMEANAKFIEGKRAKVDFAPSDRAQVDAFLSDFDVKKTPIGAYVVGQRKMRAEKARLMEEARKEDERKRKEEEEGNKGGADVVLESDELDEEELEALEEGGSEEDFEDEVEKDEEEEEYQEADEDSD